MNDSELKDWLHHADQAFALRDAVALDGSACRTVVAGRVRVRRIVAATIAACVLLATGWAARIGWQNGPPTAKSNSTQRGGAVIGSTEPQLSPRELANLRERADAFARKAAEHERMVALLHEAQQLAELQAELRDLTETVSTQIPVSVLVQEEVYRLAATQLVLAGRLVEEFDDDELAAESFRFVIDLFPDTHWSATARQALTNLGVQM